MDPSLKSFCFFIVKQTGQGKVERSMKKKSTGLFQFALILCFLKVDNKISIMGGDGFIYCKCCAVLTTKGRLCAA